MGCDGILWDVMGFYGMLWGVTETVWDGMIVPTYIHTSYAHIPTYIDTS